MDFIDEDSCDEDLTEFTSKFISATALERLHPSEAHRPLPTVSLPRLNVDLRAEILKAVRDAARAQEQSLQATIESMKRELEKTMKSRQEERQKKLAVLLEGRQTRVAQMEKWKEEKKAILHRRSGGHNEEEAECAVAVLKEAIVHLPRVIHSLDHSRSVEIEELNKREEEEDCSELEAWKEQRSHLATIIKEQNRETVARVAQLWKSTTEGESRMCKKTSAVTLVVPSQLPPLPAKLPPLPSPLPSKLPPLPSTLTAKLPPLPSKLPQLPAKLPPLNLPLRRALRTVAPLPPIQSKTKQEDLESISDHPTQVRPFQSRTKEDIESISDHSTQVSTIQSKTEQDGLILESISDHSTQVRD
ncbi:protein enabled homolog [Sardina pilchardus]|uniref:protein enabled homolog n=1 Tax=Sardina pilchardus TaxID=27697 RepID=UPI002E123225